MSIETDGDPWDSRNDPPYYPWHDIRPMPWWKSLWIWVRFGKLTFTVVGTAGDHVPAEIEIRDRWGILVGYWAYGGYDPNFPYRG